MNLFTRPMKLLTAVVLEQTTEAVIKALLQLGVMDFVHINRLDPQQMEKLSTKPSSVSRMALEDTRHRVEALLRQGHIHLPSSEFLKVDDLQKPDLETYKNVLDALNIQLLTLKDKQKQCNQRLIGFEEMKRYIAEDKGEYLDLRLGEFTHGTQEDLSSKIGSFGGILDEIKDVGKFISLTLRRDVSQVDPLLEKFGWEESSDAGLQRQALTIVTHRLEDECRKALLERSEVEGEVDAVIAEKKSKLIEIWGNLRLNELCDQIRSYFAYTRNTTLFSGWVPSDQAQAVSKAIFDASDGQCVIEWTEATEVNREEVPVAISMPKALEPFQRMVNNYATPEYGTVNPTLFVMVAYLIMFGLMFADVGQGFILLLVGLFVKFNYKKNPMKPDGLLSRNIATLLLYLGGSAITFGLLFGSYFGMNIFPALWFNFDAVVSGHAEGDVFKNVYDILGLTVKFGIVVIYTGLGINWVNLTRKKAWLKLILDKNGITGGLLFGIGLYMAFGFVKTGYHTFPTDPWITPVLLVCLIAMFFRGFLAYYLSVKEGGKTHDAGKVIFDSVMEWILDTLEIFTGYLSNTLSFMRVAGLGIAHASLMEAFKELSNMAGGVWGIAIFVLGNVLVIVLEGLSSGIQSLRLNYYEFFSRYFTGKGVAYEPVGLKSNFSL